LFEGVAHSIDGLFPKLCHPERSFLPQAKCGVKDLYAGILNEAVPIRHFIH